MKQPDKSLPSPGSGQHGPISQTTRNWLAVFLLVLAGAVLRAYMLGAKSLWLVEVFSLYAARLPWPLFLRTMWWGEANMALYYFLLSGWVHLGDSEFWLRSLSAVFGVASIPAIYALASRFVNRKAALISAALLAVNSFHIQYSQELRSYSLLTLLVILSSYAFLAILEEPERKSAWVLYVVFSSLAVYAHMFAVFALASQWVVLTPRRIRLVGIGRLLATAVAIAILTAPITAVVILERKGQLDWVPPLSLASISEVLQNFVGAGPAVSQGSWQAFLLLGLFVATWLAAVGSAWWLPQDRTVKPMSNVTLSVLTSWLVFPITAMIGISVLKSMVAPRYLFMSVPAAIVLASWGLVALEKGMPRGRLVSSMVLLVMIALSLSGVRNYYASFDTYGHKWREVTDYVLRHQEPGDAVIFYTLTGHYEFNYYAAREKERGGISTAPAVLFPITLEQASIEKSTEPYRRVWLVLHLTRPATEQVELTDIIREAVQARFHLTDEQDFSGFGVDRGENGLIRVELFVLAPEAQTASR